MAQKISVLGIDVATLVFHVVVMHDAGYIMFRKCVAWNELRHFIANLP
jgi:hypothetical protein